MDIAFGMDEGTIHLILEFYAGGNVILTDCCYNILALLRPYKLNDGTVVNIRQHYDIEPSIVEFIVHNNIEQTNPFATLSELSVDDLYDYIYGNNQMYIVFLPMEWIA